MTIPLKPPSPEERGVPYYLVAVRLKPDPTKRFARRPYDWAWLSMDSGYYSHSSDVAFGAERFHSPPSIELIRQYSGMPWYCIHDKRFAPKIYKVYEYFKKDVELVN